MGLFDRFTKPKTRNLENPSSPVSASDFLQVMGWGDMYASSGVTVNTETALGVPAVWTAVNFLAGTLAGLPLNVYRKTEGGREKVKNGLSTILHDAVNDGMSSFEWRKYSFEQVFTGGRSVTYVERTQGGEIENLFPLDPSKVEVEMLDDGRKQYRVGARVYAAADVLDIPFMLKSDMISARGPIATNRDAIGMAIAASQYGSKAFQSGGIPPAVLQGPFQSGAAAARASEDVAATTLKLAKEGRPIMALPLGHELKSIGLSPNDMQLIELQRFSIEQVARIYSLPPVFLQDLTHGTFSNTEQQDLQFVKHTVKRWVEQSEQEMNLKFFGRGSDFYVEYNVDGLLRGDLKTRMEAHATSIQNAIRTPNEVRNIENLPAKDGGDDLMIQGATVPVGTQPKNVVVSSKLDGGRNG
jgi:HK97 family phage portal protein